MDEVTKRGLRFFGEVMGEDRAEIMQKEFNSPDFGAPLGKLAADFAFGAVWSREGLARRERSLVTIGVLVAQRQTAELKNHIRMGIKNGLTVREVEEALIQTLPYVGFPANATAISAAIEVLRDMGLDLTTRTSEERGML